MNPGFWKDKKVLVTGHTGFKGSWLSLWLMTLGAQVSGLSLAPPTKPSLFDLLNIADQIDSVIGDIRNQRTVNGVINRFRPDIVIHLAAQSLVRRSYDDPLETYSTNVMGTANLLEAIRMSDSVRSALVVSSDKCYENREWVWGYREHDPIGGNDPYSSSKACVELVVSAYRKSYFCSSSRRGNEVCLASARAGNVIGGGDWATDRLVPDIMTAFMAGRPATIRNPQAIRPWQHVLDPLCGYLMIVERTYREGSKFAEAWNLGPYESEVRPVSWIVHQLAALWGNGANWTHESDEDNSYQEAAYLKVDASKARQLLGWTPMLSLLSTLEWTCEWYGEYAREGDIHSLMLDQISRYQSLL